MNMMNKMMNGMECCGNCACCMAHLEKSQVMVSEAPYEKKPEGESRMLNIIHTLKDGLEAIIQWKINLIEEDLEDGEYAVLVLDETGDDEVMGRQECEELYDEFCFDDGALEDDFGFLIVYDSTRLIEIGGSWYLVDAPLMIHEMDEDGNECSINYETVMKSRKFLKENKVELTVEGETYSAYRLNI